MSVLCSTNAACVTIAAVSVQVILLLQSVLNWSTVQSQHYMWFVFLAGHEQKPSCPVLVYKRWWREVRGLTGTTGKPEFDSSRRRHQTVVHVVLLCVVSACLVTEHNYRGCKCSTSLPFPDTAAWYKHCPLNCAAALLPVWCCVHPGPSAVRFVSFLTLL
jgi:hypothetical protein